MTETVYSATPASFEQPPFLDAHSAMIWSTEVLRARRFPKIAAFYQEAEKGEMAARMREFRAESLYVPKGAEDRLALAVLVYQAVNQLPEALQQVLNLYYWGDYADALRYRAALAFQERMRQEGLRVRLSYRYSYREVGRQLRMTHVTAKCHVDKALQLLEDALHEKFLLCTHK
ncbi:MAG: hypothetical protein WAX89_06715 [Alphaproteobacteria bacterium]